MVMKPVLFSALLMLVLSPVAAAADAQPTTRQAALPLIRPSEDKTHFVRADTGRKIEIWGFNYDHDDAGRLLEDYWVDEWATVAADFREMKALGANVVRVHLQLHRFMTTAERADAASLERLSRLVRLAEEVGLYLDVTGLGCYHKKETPPWYDALDEADRWAVQARFWKEVATVCKESPAIFCYDLMNEPVLGGGGEGKKEWLAGEPLGGKQGGSTSSSASPSTPKAEPTKRSPKHGSRPSPMRSAPSTRRT
jgi:hypothetical protein